MSVSVPDLLRIAIPMAGIILVGWLLAAVFDASTAILPLRFLEEPLVDLTRTLALAVAIVYGVRADP